MDPLVPLVRALHDRAVRFVLIGVAGANYYATNAAAVFLTEDRDFFLPPDPENLIGRDKDRLFLATHREALEQLLKDENGEGSS